MGFREQGIGNIKKYVYLIFMKYAVFYITNYIKYFIGKLFKYY